jgi:hypothetical protein
MQLLTTSGKQAGAKQRRARRKTVRWAGGVLFLRAVGGGEGRWRVSSHAEESGEQSSEQSGARREAAGRWQWGNGSGSGSGFGALKSTTAGGGGSGSDSRTAEERLMPPRGTVRKAFGVTVEGKAATVTTTTTTMAKTRTGAPRSQVSVSSSPAERDPDTPGTARTTPRSTAVSVKKSEKYSSRESETARGGE